MYELFEKQNNATKKVGKVANTTYLYFGYMKKIE